MPNSGLYGPYLLTDNIVDKHVVGKGPGAYALGTVTANGSFSISYIGRSDTDLNQRLHQHVGEAMYFKYAFFNTSRLAYEKECQLYHDFPTYNNKVHPDNPNRMNLDCPICNY